MSEFKIGDRVIVRSYPADGEKLLIGRVGRVIRPASQNSGYAEVRMRVAGCGDHPSWLLEPRELTLAPSRRAEVGVDGPAAVHCYCAKESPLSTYTASEGHYQEEGE